MTEQTAATVQYVATLAVLAAVTLGLAAMHDEHAGESLAGTLGFAVSARPVARGPLPPAVTAAVTLGLAGVLAITSSGCTGAVSTRDTATTACAIARKVCSSVDAACALAAPTEAP